MSDKRLKEIAEFLMGRLSDIIGADGLLSELGRIGVTDEELELLGYGIDEEE